MSLFKKKEDKNLLDMVPFHVIKTFTEHEGLVTLNLPKFKNAVLSKWLVPGSKSETINIKFDKIGSLMWTHMDGIRSIQTICDIIRQQCLDGVDLNNLEERSAKFITELYKSRFIKFTEHR